MDKFSPQSPNLLQYLFHYIHTQTHHQFTINPHFLFPYAAQQLVSIGKIIPQLHLF